MKYKGMLCCYSNLHVLQALEQLKSEESKRNRFGDVREESLVQESETREAGLLTKIADLESDLKVAKKGERRAVNEVERLLSQNGGLLKEVDKQHDELKKVMAIFVTAAKTNWNCLLHLYWKGFTTILF